MPVVVLHKDGRRAEERLNMSELRRLSGLQARELLMVETSSIAVSPRILPRGDVVVITVAHIRALVFLDRVLVFKFRDSSTQREASAQFIDALEAELLARNSTEAGAKPLMGGWTSLPIPNCIDDSLAPFEVVVIEQCLQSVIK